MAPREETMSKRWSYVTFGLLGGAVGAAVALLSAPAPGVQTRRRLLDWAGEESGRVARTGRNALVDIERVYYNEGADDFADVVNA
jgi:gas vesicle protein